MKVIDLLNKIANGEEVPKRIKYHQNYYSWFKGFSGNNGYCKEPLQADGNSYLGINTLYDLNNEVEIIEDVPISKMYINNKLQYDLKEDKKIEKLMPINILPSISGSEKKRKQFEIDSRIDQLFEKVNEIIDKINEVE